MRQDDKDTVNVEKRADILQATFKHYFEMAMDHHTKAATTSNILLVIVGAIIGLIGLDREICGVGDVVGGTAVLAIGVFGAAWAWKQHERYFYWSRMAYEYQKELIKIVPGLKPCETYEQAVREKTAKEFCRMFAERIYDRYLWASLHLFVAAVGLVLFIVAAIFRCPVVN